MLSERTNAKQLLYERDSHGREIFLYKINKAVIIGDSIHYPKVRLYSLDDRASYNPIDEAVMSLQGVGCTEITRESTAPSVVDEYRTPVFYFIYNTDNYYHFLYDTLPYLISYLKIKDKITSL